jgi:hypothetical protein
MAALLIGPPRRRPPSVLTCAYLVEFENGAGKRSELYGKELINRLSAKLKERGLKGVSATNLKQCRSFYQTYSTQSSRLLEIRQTLSDRSLTEVLGKSGIILCKRKNDALVEITLPENASVYASEYGLYLPSKEELRQKLLSWTE